MDDLTTYKQRLNLQDATFERIEHEEAMVATVYKVIHPTGLFILKICGREGDYLREVLFLNKFAGIIPVPRIVKLVPKEAILMECLPGTLLTNLSEELAFEIGSVLARIHLERASGFGDPVNTLNQDPKAYFIVKFNEGLGECRGRLPEALIDQCHDYFFSHVDLLDSVDGPCIVHRDFRPGNLIVNAEKLQGVIDWSGARYSFAEEDFCSMEHGEWPSNISFLKGYAHVRNVPNYHRLMPLLRLSKAIATIGFTVKRGTWDNTGARIYLHNLKYLQKLFESP